MNESGAGLNEISAVGIDQTAGVEKINKVIVQLDAGTQQNTAMVEESAAASLRLIKQQNCVIR